MKTKNEQDFENVDGSVDWPDQFRMHAILWGFELIKQGKDKEPQSAGAMEPLLTALAENRWDLIEGAAEKARLRSEGDFSDKDLGRKAKELAYHLSYMGINKRSELVVENVEEWLTKKDILDIIRIQYPKEYEQIPPSPRALSLWWKEVDPDTHPEPRHGDLSLLKKCFFESIDPEAM